MAEGVSNARAQNAPPHKIAVSDFLVGAQLAELGL
jgi:hypothetical protein